MKLKINNAKGSNEEHSNYKSCGYIARTPLSFFKLLTGLFIIISLLLLAGCSLKGSTGSAENELSNPASSEIIETKTGADNNISSENNAGENIEVNDSQGNKNTPDDTAEAVQNTDSLNDETGSTNNEGQSSSDAQNPDESQPSNIPDETAAQNDLSGSEGQDIKITPKAPEVSLQVISGPEYAQENQVCFYRVKANINGEPFPQIKFNKDDSNGAWGLNVAQVNLIQGQSFTLVCEAVNSLGSAAAEINLGWVDNPNPSGDSAEQDAPQIVVDYTDTANFLIDVNLSYQQVTVLYKNVAIKNMACSGGKPETPTPQGIYTTNQKIYYAWIPKFAMGAYYWTRFYGPYLFHSVPYDSAGNMLIEELNKMGNPVSHGCVRLVLEDAKWLYETLPIGIKVSIHN
jgi:hypothetical protein